MSVFPDPRELPEDEWVAAVGPVEALQTALLIEAYGKGLFPWPQDPAAIPWVSPHPRGVLFFAELHIPRSLRQAQKKTGFEFSFDRAFPEVIRACAAMPRPSASGETWILPEMVEAYTRLHEAGRAHSVECWEGGELVGGVYGVHVDGAFSGESMFYKRDNASKLCLVRLIERLQSRGLTWMDVQMVTPVVELFGGRYIPRGEYLDLLDAAHRRGLAPRLNL
ncbi:MAG: leucyl/phenylalanyl-tRNA--protein transferase [Elusimicrobiota bacterium]